MYDITTHKKLSINSKVSAFSPMENGVFNHKKSKLSKRVTTALKTKNESLKKICGEKWRIMGNFMYL
ncbi:hypothetical protein HMPREF3034_00248 [Prevotella sp. DNF00663]|nr:hypothetical protein HMPREF0671_00945 [Prevotella sp. S7 MS 2]KXB85396.1 hypothetical protein HMPREF3034_00248 [Prevotella sp. DNF00663]